MGLALSVPLTCLAAAQTGDVGRTSYATLPFQSQVYSLCWNCSPNLEPAELFFAANSQSPLNSSEGLKATRNSVADLEKAGTVPSAGVQRWESTFAASFPQGTFQGEPDWVTSDRAEGLPNQPEFAAWRDWIVAHPQYLDVAADGGTMPVSFRSWGGSWGHISPLTPLDPADCPPTAPKACDWGDLYAYRWSLSSAKTGAYGLILSDFTDSQPGFASNIHDFNPRIVAAFLASDSAADSGAPVQASVPDQARWIVANRFNQWNDFIATGYAKFYAALIADVGAKTGKKVLVVDQCGLTPASRRLFGVDARIMAQSVPPQNYVCMWDDHVMQEDRQGPIEAPPLRELAGFVLAAAREPSIRNGANLEADDPAFWKGIAKFYPTLGATDQHEVGLKLLKRLWVWSAWAHVADRSGQVRRALAFTSRDYWDTGKLAALDPLSRAIQSTVPARPFGPAFYYSAAAERSVEASQGKALGTQDQDLATYLPAADLQAAIDGGAPVGYYVSDAALPAIHKGTANAPSAWIVLDADGRLPADEQASLSAVAPVVTATVAVNALQDQPFTLSRGLAGFGFYDAKGALVFVVSNPPTAADAQTVDGTVKLAGLTLPDGAHALKDLLTNATRPVQVVNHQATIPVHLARWDTAIFSLGAS